MKVGQLFKRANGVAQIFTNNSNNLMIVCLYIKDALKFVAQIRAANGFAKMN